MQHFRRGVLRSDQTGATFVEFALVFPVFLMLLLAILEYSIVLYLRSTIEDATRSTARMAITGNMYDATSGVSRAEYLDQQLRERVSAVVLKPENVTVHTTLYDTYGNVRAGNGVVMSGVNFGSANQIVEYTVVYQHDFLTPIAALAGWTTGSSSSEETLNNSLLIMSTAFAKNENF